MAHLRKIGGFSSRKSEAWYGRILFLVARSWDLLGSECRVLDGGAICGHSFFAILVGGLGRGAFRTWVHDSWTVLGRTFFGIFYIEDGVRLCPSCPG